MNGYYVDEWTGLVCSTSKAPSGCHFEFKVKEGYTVKPSEPQSCCIVILMHYL